MYSMLYDPIPCHGAKFLNKEIMSKKGFYYKPGRLIVTVKETYHIGPQLKLYNKETSSK